MRKYQTQIKSIFHLAWPAIVQEALNVVVTYVDTAMVGALGASASAAVGLTGSVGWLVSSIAVNRYLFCCFWNWCISSMCSS